MTYNKGQITGKSLLSRTVIFIISCLCLTPISPAHVMAKVKAPKMRCHSYAVMDAGSGELLFGQKANKKIYPASTAKLMTAIVCVENGDVDSVIKTRSEIVNNTTYGTYCLGIGSGIRFRFKDLLHMSLMASAADATDSLAAGVFGSKKNCVKAMNEKCRELGLTETSFDNPVGSDIGGGFNETYSTAREMALITRYAMANPLIRSVVGKKSYEVTSGQDILFNTTNWFLRGLAYYDKDAYRIIGSKSGTTNAAGQVFIATAVDREGHEVICAYFGNVSKESTFASIRKLLDYTFKKYKKGKLTLTKSNYDVRGLEGVRQVYDEYASLNCYPGDKSGKFYPNMAITRQQLVRMMGSIDNLGQNGILTAFAGRNASGKVTIRKFASLLAELYPAHLSEEETADILASNGTLGAEEMSGEEKEAFAIFIKNGMAAEESCYNGKQFITRKQALLILDKLSDYQLRYYASHPYQTALPGAEGISYPTLDKTPAMAFNSKWMGRLKEQAEQREAEKLAKQKEAEEQAKRKKAAEPHHTVKAVRRRQRILQT